MSPTSACIPGPGRPGRPGRAPGRLRASARGISRAARWLAVLLATVPAAGGLRPVTAAEATAAASAEAGAAATADVRTESNIDATIDATAEADGMQYSAAVRHLQAYLRIDTVNPPGNESAGVAWLGARLDEAGIPWQSAESAPGRGNLWARLEGGDAPALVLIHHIDTVPADRDHWRTDPLSGAIRDGYLYGRGAIDMKGIGVIQLEAFLALARSGRPLNRDVVFVATADEEAGGAMGAGWMVEHHPEVFEGAGFLLNEGGGGHRNGEATTFEVEVTQKIPLWLRLTATDQPGHGSVPRTSSAVTRILAAGERIAEARHAPRVLEPVAALFAGTADQQREEFRGPFRDIRKAVDDPQFLARLQALSPADHALLHDTCAVTRLEGSSKINVIPPSATLEVDCRLLPDQDPARFTAALQALVGDPAIRVEQLLSFSPAQSSTATPLFTLIEAINRERFDARTVPGVSTGFTDSHFFRDLGITAYGYAPIVLAEHDAPGVHGNDERIPIRALDDGVAAMTELLLRFTAVPR